MVKLFEDGDEREPKWKRPDVKSYRQARAELVPSEQVNKGKYQQEFPQKLIEMASKGLSLRAFAATIEVSYPTLYKWAHDIPEFKEAMEIAEMKRHLFYEVTAMKNLSNKDFNNQLFIRLAQTVGRWADDEKVRDARVSAGEPETLNPALMTPEQRRERIKELTERICLEG